MTHTTPDSDIDDTPLNQSWFTRPLAGWQCVVGWCVSIGVFIGVVALAGGTAIGDAWESIYATWAVAHGQLSCMYPPHPATIFTYASPGYPLLAGGIGAIAQVGHGVPFPSGAALGHDCDHAILAMVHWSQAGGAIVPTLRTGYLTWLFLMGGLIWLLRAAGRGRSGWEPTTLVIVACLPPVWLSVEQYFHPQDIVAMGFALAALGCALRNHWVGVGILIAMAVLTNEYALLVAVPLLVIAPARSRIPYVAAAVVTAVVVDGPILALTSGAAAHYVLYGSGNAVGTGGTVVWEWHLPGVPLLLVSRILPLVLSFLLACYVLRRIGPAAREPAVLIALVAVSLSFRLVFEQNIFSYYYLALSVMLVVLDVVRGRIRETLVAWLLMVSLVYTEPYIFIWRHSWDEDARHWLPVVVMAVGLLMIVRAVLRHRLGWNVFMWAAAVVTSLFNWPVSSDPLSHVEPVTWLWQVILVGIGVALAASPLWTLLRAHSTPPPTEQVKPVMAVVPE